MKMTTECTVQPACGRQVYKRFGKLKKIRKSRYRLKDNIKVDIIADGYAVLG
jgi:4-hydroxy-3-methylbut-2-en-1-yl diphosphate synthase IspG/GcpE